MKILTEVYCGERILDESFVVNDVKSLKKHKGEYLLLDFYDYKHAERWWIVRGRKTVIGKTYDMTFKEFIEKIEWELSCGYRFVAVPRNHKTPLDSVFDELTRLLESIEAPLPYDPLSLSNTRYYKALNKAIHDAEANGLYDNVKVRW